MSAELSPKANPMDAFQSAWYRVALLFIAVLVSTNTSKKLWLRGFTQGADLWLLSPCLHRVPQIPLPL